MRRIYEEKRGIRYYPRWIILMIGITLIIFSVNEALSASIRSKNAFGVQRFLVLAVRFPNIRPQHSLKEIREDVLEGISKYFSEQSYGKTQITGEVKGWYELPRRMEDYKVYLDNWVEDKKRGVLLAGDALNAAEKDVRFEKYDHVIIVLGVRGKEFGMRGYTINPGALSGVQRGKAQMVKMTTSGGQIFAGGVTLATKDAHLGQMAVDVAVVLGGVIDGKRVIPMLYDVTKNIGTPRGQAKLSGGRSEMRQKWQTFMGPWDLLSCHFVELDLPPPAMSSFPRLRLGWIAEDQVIKILPGESRAVTLQPLGNGQGSLVIRIPGRSDTYYLLENRQKVPGDPIMPTTGLLVLHVDESKEDGEGIVRIVDASPKVPHFGGATFGVKEGQITSVSLPRDVAVEVLWQTGLDLTVAVTTRSKASEIQAVAKLIRECQRRIEGEADLPDSAKTDLNIAMGLLMALKVSEARTKIQSIAP